MLLAAALVPAAECGFTTLNPENIDELFDAPR
jgi:hypothetical protein